MESQKIFVSCATHSELVSENWIRKFSNTIRLLIENYMGKPVEIATSFDQNNTQFINKANIILMVVSSDYFEDKGVREELDLFYKRANDPGTTVYQLNFTDKPEISQNKDLKSSVYNFDLENPFGKVDLNNQDDYVSEKSFWLKLVDFSMSICPDCYTKPAVDKKVLIAETGPDLQDARDSIIRELQHNGYSAISPFPDGLKNNIEVQFEEACKQADIIVHIVGGEKAQKVNGHDIITLQNNIASDFCQKSKKTNRLIWIPEDLLIKDENQRLLIEKLKRDNTALQGAEIVQMPIETFKDILLHRVKKKAKSNHADESKQHKVYLIYHQSQGKDAASLKQQLKQKDLNVIDPLIAEHKKELLFHHWQSLIICNSVILLFNKEHSDWLESKKKDIIKATGLGRNKPIANRILLVEPGDKPESSLKKEFKIVENNKQALDTLANDLISNTEL